MTINDNSFVCFKRETTAGTATITAADSTTSYMGKYTDKDEKTKELEIEVSNEIIEYWNNDARNANLVYGQRELPIFRKSIVLTNMIPYYAFLGYGALVSSTGTCSMRNTGKKDSYTLRAEERGGTNQLQQMCGSYLINMYGKSEMNMAEIAIADWVYMSIEDNGDRSALTTMPTDPESVATTYGGKPEVTWDVGGGGEVALPECFKAEWKQTHNFEVVSNAGVNAIKLHEYSSVDLILTAILGANTQWDALIDRTTHDINVKTYKDNTTYYNTKKFDDCKIKKYHKLGKLDTGGYLTVLELKAKLFTVDFINEFAGNFTTWFVNAPPA